MSRPPSLRITTHTIPQATLLFIDIKGFTSTCASMTAGSVGEWVAAFYERVDVAAAAHGVSMVEVRGDCCICIAGAEGAVPGRAFAAAAADPAASQATRILAFAAALHADLATLPAGAAATVARMGVATGEVSLLVSDGAAPFASVNGDTAALAAQMEALSCHGAAHVHWSTATLWAAEARRPPPSAIHIECGGRGVQLAAVYDCAARDFRINPAAAPAARGAAPRIGRAMSSLF